MPLLQFFPPVPKAPLDCPLRTNTPTATLRSPPTRAPGRIVAPLPSTPLRKLTSVLLIDVYKRAICIITSLRASRGGTPRGAAFHLLARDGDSWMDPIFTPSELASRARASSEGQSGAYPSERHWCVDGRRRAPSRSVRARAGHSGKDPSQGVIVAVSWRHRDRHARGGQGDQTIGRVRKRAGAERNREVLRVLGGGGGARGPEGTGEAFYARRASVRRSHAGRARAPGRRRGGDGRIGRGCRGCRGEGTELGWRARNTAGFRCLVFARADVVRVRRATRFRGVRVARRDERRKFHAICHVICHVGGAVGSRAGRGVAADVARTRARRRRSARTESSATRWSIGAPPSQPRENRGRRRHENNRVYTGLEVPGLYRVSTMTKATTTTTTTRRHSCSLRSHHGRPGRARARGRRRGRRRASRTVLAGPRVRRAPTCRTPIGWTRPRVDARGPDGGAHFFGVPAWVRVRTRDRAPQFESSGRPSPPPPTSRRRGRGEGEAARRGRGMRVVVRCGRRRRGWFRDGGGVAPSSACGTAGRRQRRRRWLRDEGIVPDVGNSPRWRCSGGCGGARAHVSRR